MKFSLYDFVCKTDEGYCIFNTFRTKYIKINKEDEIKHFEELINSEVLPADDEMVKILYKEGFLVDSDFDEYALAKERIRRISASHSDCLEFLVYTTEQCNFRCIYCPQEHLDNHLSDEKWESIYKFVKRNIEEEGKKRVHIAFFGGEPLLKANKIISFLGKMKELNNKHNIEMMFHATTNGYLLTPNVYDQIASFDLPFSFQITLDGFAESHNKTRVRVDGEGTWEKIVENLKYINTKEDKLSVTLRTNVGPENKDSMDGFYKWASETFNNKKFKFHIEEVAKYSDRVSDDVCCNATFEELEQIRLQAADTGKGDEARCFQILGGACPHSISRFFAVAVNGTVYRCDNNHLYDESYDMPIGYFDDDGNMEYTVDVDELETYEIDKCATCKVYPICAARACPAQKMRDPVNRPDCLYKGSELEETIVSKINSGVIERLLRQEMLHSRIV